MCLHSLEGQCLLAGCESGNITLFDIRQTDKELSSLKLHSEPGKAGICYLGKASFLSLSQYCVWILIIQEIMEHVDLLQKLLKHSAYHKKYIIF